MFLVGLVVFKSRGDVQGETTEQAPQKNKILPVYGLVVMVGGFLFYSESTKFIAYFFILGAMVFLAWTLFAVKTLLYVVTFFGRALLHHLADFIQCDWNPFGPWAPDIVVGLFLWCDYNNILFYLIEIPPYVIVLVLIIIRTGQYMKNKEMKQGTDVDPDTLVEIDNLDNDEKNSTV